MRLAPRLILSTAVAVLLTACADPQTYTGSGAAFLAARSGPVDPQIAAAAAGEAQLRFPARIGIARISGGALTDPPKAESDLMASFAQSAQGFGDFQTVSQIIAETIVFDSFSSPIRRAQITAARQHLDYVLIYDLDRRRDSAGAVGVGQVLFMDVRSGHVYGTTSAEVSVAGLGRGRGARRQTVLSDAAALKVFRELMPQVAKLFNDLARDAR